jgi:hypothetical protein
MQLSHNNKRYFSFSFKLLFCMQNAHKRENAVTIRVLLTSLLDVVLFYSTQTTHYPPSSSPPTMKREEQLPKGMEVLQIQKEKVLGSILHVLYVGKPEEVIVSISN